MGNWAEILEETKKTGSTYDLIRRKYLKKIRYHTNRNVIAYYSGWLQKPQLGGLPALSVGDADMTGFMATIHKTDPQKGLDLILHTPGGSIAATEALATYLRSIYGTEIRAIVPQVALSAGSMIALSCRQVVMGKHSSLGPIDPQVDGMAAHGVVEEFTTAVNETKADPARGPYWGVIISQYSPTLIGECIKAIQWSEQLVTDWLTTGMLLGNPNAPQIAATVVKELGDHAVTKSHSRHFNIDAITSFGVNTLALESDPRLQDLVLSYHHATIQTFAATAAVKIIENHRGVAYIEQVNVLAAQQK